MNYCPKCGAQLGVGQNFCGNCGFDVREKPAQQQFLEASATHEARGLGRNTLVYLAHDGINGFELRPVPLLLLSIVVPVPILAGLYSAIQTGALAVYITFWIAASALLYDELRWRGVRRLGANQDGRTSSWFVPWQSIRKAEWNGKTLWFSSANLGRKRSVTFDKSDAPFVESTLNSWGIRYSWRPPRLPSTFTRFWTLVLILFITGQAILILAATLPFFPGEEQLYTTILNNTQSKIAGTSFIGEFQAILLNNIQVAWGGALPFLGTLTYGVASYNTGRVVQAIAISDQVPSSLVLASLYLYPHTWVEESAYPIATVAGLLAFTKWRSVSPSEFASRMNRGSTKLAIALVGAGAVLIVAGFLEVLGTYLGLAVVLLWAPLAILYYLWTSYQKRRLTRTLGSP